MVDQPRCRRTAGEPGSRGVTTPQQIRSYDDLQAVLRAVAEERQISREELDNLAGLPRGYASKVLAAVPMRRLGPDTLGPMLGALGVMLVPMTDPEAKARFTERADKRTEFRAKNASMHSGTVHVKISVRKLRQNQRKGGTNSRKFVSRKKARKLARRAAWMRWERRRLIELTRPMLSVDGGSCCRWTPALSQAILRARKMGLSLRFHTKSAPAAETRQRQAQPPGS